MDNRMEKLAKLAIMTGINLKKGQNVLINCSVDSKELARIVAKEAYLAGAKKVIVKYFDEYLIRDNYFYQDEETLCNIPNYIIEENKFFMDEYYARVAIISPKPNLMDDVDPNKQQKADIALQKCIQFYREFIMKNNVSWTIIADANPLWAKKVFPNLDEEEAVCALRNAIFDASRVTKDNDPIEEWRKHNANLSSYSEKMNNFDFSKLVFKNSLGTCIEVGLVKNHIWSGGIEYNIDGTNFNPNIPSEEIFTMPDKYRVNGRVYSVKPLDYQGKLINDFYLDFKDGKVVNYDAKENKEALKALIEFDEGSSYLGEVALIPSNSAISLKNVIFYNTLFDENASCHLALGRAYPMNINGGLKMSKEELMEHNSNTSMVHVDFMFGTKDMSVIGVKENGEEIQVFKDGNFVI